MKTNSIPDQSILLLKKVLDLRANNEKVIASNIANSETPGYSPSKFTFEDELKHAVQGGSFALSTTHSNHIPLAPQNLGEVRGKVMTKKDTTGIGDQNAVDLDQEMLDLSKNELLYETAVQLLHKKLSLKKFIIQGGQ